MPAEPPANPTMVGAAAAFLLPGSADTFAWHTIDLTGDKRPCHTYSQPLAKSHVVGDGLLCVPCSLFVPATIRPVRLWRTTPEQSPIWRSVGRPRSRFSCRSLRS